MLDTRNEVARLLERFEFRSGPALLKSLICLSIALAVMLLPAYPGMPDSARWSLGIVTLGACLWISEAMPAFAVALLIIGLQILVLGRPGGVLAEADESSAWEIYVRPWASPPMWLFFGGLVLASAAARTGMDRWVAGGVLRLTKGRPSRLLPSVMGVTFVFSMFMSNTATCAMMLAVLTPALATLPKDSPVAKSLLLGLAFAASIGGMATIIGTPPNAIGAGFLSDRGGITFLRWMILGLPPALILGVLCWVLLRRPIRAAGNQITLQIPEATATDQPEPHDRKPRLAVWQKGMTLFVFLLTVILWMTGAIHGAPTAVVSFLPIVILCMIGVIRAEEIRSLQWDVLLLLAGGLSLGAGIEASGLAAWMGTQIQDTTIPPWAVALVLSYVAALASNLMSNTAAANILLPIGLVIATAVGGGLSPESVIVPVALSCSIAMALPIATPPNALVFASGRLQTRDYLPGGILALLIGPPLNVGWCQLLS
jgi:sodium-dependent dicarboxylate transporter 2/3/5